MPLLNENLFSTENFTTSEEVDKGTKNLDDRKKALVPTPLSKEQLLRTEKVTTNKEVDKGTKKLDDKK